MKVFMVIAILIYILVVAVVLYFSKDILGDACTKYEDNKNVEKTENTENKE